MNKKHYVVIFISLILATYYYNIASLTVSLTAIQADLHMDANSIHWIVNIFNLALLAFLLIGGKMSDYLGVRATSNLGIILFFSGSLLCAVSTREYSLLAGRIFQGWATAFLFPVVDRMSTMSFLPESRGKYVGWVRGIGNLFLPIGTVLGGIFVTYASWRLNFFFQAFGAVVLFAYAFFIPRVPHRRGATKMDLAGCLFFSIGLIGIITALMQGNSWGWTSYKVLIIFFAGVLVLAGFLLWNAAAETPTINFHLFKKKIIISVLIISFTLAGARMMIYFWAIILEHSFGLSAAYIGFLFLLGTVSPAILNPIMGSLFHRIGPKILVWSIVLALAAIILIMAAVLLKSLLFFILGLLCYGCFIPLYSTPCALLVYTHTKEQFRGKISSLISLNIHSGSTVIYALLSALLTTIQTKSLKEGLSQNRAEVLGFEGASSAMGALLVLAVVFFFLLKDKKPKRT